MTDRPVIAFIGAGNMAFSLITGLIQQGYPANRLWATNPSIAKLHRLQKHWGLHISTDNMEAATQADVIALTIKPSVVTRVCHELSETLKQRNCLIISSAVGVTTETMQKALGYQHPIVRAMPNTPVAVGAGVTGLYANLHVNEPEKEFTESLFRSVGTVQWVLHERDLNVITAISGSGPAYFLYFMEALEEAALSQGLSKDVAHLLTVQTALGAAKLALTSEQTFSELREKISPPNGTTEAAMKVMEYGRITDTIVDAAKAAYARAEALSKA
ncbi:MAG: pyrroline-5-carboxylate reductase [Legionellales bacterium]|nr:pyrroline-5-carboxylate reductase [Legionellales bacterium]